MSISCVEIVGFVPPLVQRIEFVSFVKFLGGDSRNPSRGEGGDVELGARTSKYILVFVFDYLSKLYFFISYIAIVVHLYMRGIVLVFTLVLIQASY